MALAVLGMRGTGNFNAAERPKNWRQGILLMFPSGDAPLTAIMSKLREQPTDDAQFSWFEKGLPEQRALILGASTTLSAAPANNGTIAANDSNTTIAITTLIRGQTGSTSDTSIFKPGHVLYNEVGDEAYLVVKKASVGGTDYLICLRNLGAKYTMGTNDPAVTGNTADATGDHVQIVGSGFPEGASIGQAVAYAPVKHWNLSQIMRTPLFLTRTARKTRLRWDTSGPYNEARREALQLHAIEMERAFFFGQRAETTSLSNPDAPLDMTGTGQPLRTTRGILNWLPTATTTAVSIHTDLSSFNSSTLTEAIWDSFLEESFRYGSREKACFVGSTALNVITQLAKNKATVEVVPTDTTYGMHLVRYLTPFGTLYLINHPLLSDNPTWRKDLYVIDVDKLTYRYITDTVFLRNRQSPGDDASKDEFLTEAGLELHFSGATPGGEPSGDPASPNLIPTPAAHGRLKGVATYGG